jgi:hypothetical protein
MHLPWRAKVLLAAFMGEAFMVAAAFTEVEGATGKLREGKRSEEGPHGSFFLYLIPPSRTSFHGGQPLLSII